MTQPRTGPSDAQLVGGMAAGRLDALEGFYDRYAADAYGAARYATSDPAVAEDRVRDGFLEAWRGAEGWDSAQGTVRDWLLGIVLGERVVPGGPASGPEEPPPALRARVLSYAYADVAERRHPAAAPPSTPAGQSRIVVVGGETVEVRDGVAVTAQGERDLRVGAARRSITLVAAAVVFVVGAWGLLMNQQVTGLQAYLDGVEAAITLAGAEGSATAPLRAPDGGAVGLAVVGGEGEVQLVLRDLASTAGTQVYAAWARAPGATGWTPIAEFTVGRDRAASAGGTLPDGMALPVEIQVTREPTGSAATPSGEPVAAGAVSAPAP